ncbi:MAG: aminotransferase class V-fold PLP-dependent enzyme [Sporomusaceae bacterium]|nr:aminotransferase class V-fold PLP-dependent enzyme [Sporomusaceae bacterium]
MELKNTKTASWLRSLVVGADTLVPVQTGERVTAVNFDNAATTPPFCAVIDEINAFAPWYSSVHRGKGYKSILTSEFYEQARQIVKKFVGAAADDHVIFTKSTTESINLLAAVLAPGDERAVVLSTDMEHLANDLPWRRHFVTEYAGLDNFGRVSLDSLENKLRQHRGSVKLVTVTGASNVTGYVNPVHAIARLAHRYGAKILVDGAQLVPHMPFAMNNGQAAERIDFLAFSAHKMYAPFGSGVLIGRCRELTQAEPLLWGGGAVGLVSHRFINWDDPPGRYEAGTPNVMGVAALVAAVRVLEAENLAAIHQYESRLIGAIIDGLASIRGIRLYSVADCEERVSLVSFTLEGIGHGELAQALAQEAGIAVRNGLFCAHPYVEKLLKINDQQLQFLHTHAEAPVPGLVRVSLGLYNTMREAELFLHTVRRIAGDPAYYGRKYREEVRDDRGCTSRQSDLC